MITISHHGNIIGEWPTVASFVQNHFDYSLNNSRQLVLSGTPLRHYKNKTYNTTNSYSNPFTPEEAVRDWANSLSGKAFLRLLGFSFYQEH